MPKVSVEAVNVHALLQIGNVTQMFVGTAGSCKSIGDANVWFCVLIGGLEKDQEHTATFFFFLNSFR